MEISKEWEAVRAMLPSMSARLQLDGLRREYEKVTMELEITTGRVQALSATLAEGDNE